MSILRFNQFEMKTTKQNIHYKVEKDERNRRHGPGFTHWDMGQLDVLPFQRKLIMHIEKV